MNQPRTAVGPACRHERSAGPWDAGWSSHPGCHRASQGRAESDLRLSLPVTQADPASDWAGETAAGSDSRTPRLGPPQAAGEFKFSALRTESRRGQGTSSAQESESYKRRRTYTKVLKFLEIPKKCFQNFRAFKKLDLRDFFELGAISGR